MYTYDIIHCYSNLSHVSARIKTRTKLHLYWTRFCSTCKLGKNNAKSCNIFKESKSVTNSIKYRIRGTITLVLKHVGMVIYAMFDVLFYLAIIQRCKQRVLHVWRVWTIENRNLVILPCSCNVTTYIVYMSLAVFW